MESKTTIKFIMVELIYMENKRGKPLLFIHDLDIHQFQYLLLLYHQLLQKQELE